MTPFDEMSPGWKHQMTVYGLYQWSKKKGLVRAVTDCNLRYSCPRESDSRFSHAYIASTSVIVWQSLFMDFLDRSENRFYHWRMDDLRMRSSQVVKWMYAMREYGLYPIGVTIEDILSENWDKAPIEFSMTFQSEEDMVAGGALM